MQYILIQLFNKSFFLLVKIYYLFDIHCCSQPLTLTNGMFSRTVYSHTRVILTTSSKYFPNEKVLQIETQYFLCNKTWFFHQCLDEFCALTGRAVAPLLYRRPLTATTCVHTAANPYGFCFWLRGTGIGISATILGLYPVSRGSLSALHSFQPLELLLREG